MKNPTTHIDECIKSLLQQVRELRALKETIGELSDGRVYAPGADRTFSRDEWMRLVKVTEVAEGREDEYVKCDEWEYRTDYAHYLCMYLENAFLAH